MLSSRKKLPKVLNLTVVFLDILECGRLAQLGERGVRNAEVVGSSPIPSTNFFIKIQ